MPAARRARPTRALLLAIAVAACGSDSTGPDRAGPDDLIGEFALEFADGSRCSPNYEGVYRFILNVEQVDGDPVAQLVSASWRRPAEEGVWHDATGFFDFDARALELRLAYTDTAQHVVITAQFDADLNLDGTFVSQGVNYSGTCAGNFAGFPLP